MVKGKFGLKIKDFLGEMKQVVGGSGYGSSCGYCTNAQNSSQTAGCYSNYNGSGCLCLYRNASCR